MAESGGGRDSQIYSSEVYSWSPVYRNQRGGGEPSSAAPYSSNRQSVLYHSGLKQQVAGRQAELQEVSVRKETAVEVEGRKTDPKVANDSLHNAFAKTGELIFISLLAGLIVLVFFLGIFFTFYHTS